MHTNLTCIHSYNWWERTINKKRCIYWVLFSLDWIEPADRFIGNVWLILKGKWVIWLTGKKNLCVFTVNMKEWRTIHQPAMFVMYVILSCYFARVYIWNLLKEKRLLFLGNTICRFLCSVEERCTFWLEKELDTKKNSFFRGGLLYWSYAWDDRFLCLIFLSALMKSVIYRFLQLSCQSWVLWEGKYIFFSL